MNYNQIRKTFLDFFQKNNHEIVKSYKLIPEDKSILFTVAGMVPWKNILQGIEKPISKRVADVQKCLRAGGKHNDLDEVGIDGRHHTFFEMMGNWSFGDYFKEQAIKFSWDLLTKELNLDPGKIRITTHISDEEATILWKKISGKEAIRLGDKDNWWSMGDIGPCGPCTEIFYDFGSDIKNEDDRWVEIWNNVFMQYDRDANGNLNNLPKQNVDTGAGLERWAALLQNKTDNYDTDLFVNLMKSLEEILSVKKTEDNKSSFKIIVDHLRAISFALADGVRPSNTDRGYVIRRILRRAMRQGQLLGSNEPFLYKLYPSLLNEMGDWYSELEDEKDTVIKIIRDEEESFIELLKSGTKLLNQEISKLGDSKTFSGEIAFKLFDTYGFPFDLTESILSSKKITVDENVFNKCMLEQKERSRTDTKGTKTIWESKRDVLSTIDSFKYNPEDKLESKVLAILRNNEFVLSANAKDEVEIVLDKTNFYATSGGQVNDLGYFEKNNQKIFNVSDVFKVSNFIVHKGILEKDIKVSDILNTVIDRNNRDKTALAHSATHLLQAALRKVLGNEVLQKGSKVSPNSVRFDFSFSRALTEEEKQKVEDLINSWIDEKLEVRIEEMSIDKAKELGAIALFGEKYGNIVRTVSIGDVSIELCGGIHVKNTKELIKVSIIKEKSISSGIRRITMNVGQD